MRDSFTISVLGSNRSGSGINISEADNQFTVNSMQM